MNRAHVVIGLARRLFLWAARFAGAAVLAYLVAFALGGRDLVWRFAEHDQHRFTAMAMLDGTLRLRDGISQLRTDEQAFNGAVYTNWGFGVPLLQAPFEWFARRRHLLGGTFFPDRAILFAYVGLLGLALWSAFDRALRGPRPGPRWSLGRNFLSFSAAQLALAYALYPISACRFQVYEETICYAIVVQLFAVAAYLLTLDATSFVPAALLGLVAGIGLVVRPTGLVYLAMWGALVLLRRWDWRALGVFVLGASPALAFWLISNDIKGGSPFAFGMNNSTPFLSYHLQIVRFGSHCLDTARHAGTFVLFLANALFGNPTIPASDHLQKCHFDLEGRLFPAHMTEPLLGPGTLFFLLAASFFAFHRQGRLARLVPLGAIAGIFATFALAGVGLAFRYLGDFTPILVLVAAQLVRAHRLSVVRFPLRWGVALLGLSGALYVYDVEPYKDTIHLLDPTKVGELASQFQSFHMGPEQPGPAHLDCGKVHEPPYRNGEGWNGSCTVDDATNVFLGVPAKPDDRYTLRFKASGDRPDEVRVYVNGRYYEAHMHDDVYEVPLDLKRGQLFAPMVMVSMRWAPNVDPPSTDLKLEWVEIV